MKDTQRSNQIEFIRLGGHNVRVTSWTAKEDAGRFTLVTITRGSRDAELLDKLLGQESVMLELEGQEPIGVRATAIDRREFGEGQSAITRFAVELATGDDTATKSADPLAPTLLDRVAALETELAVLRAIVRRLAGDQ